jgi:tetratricopeptide (TPR) repeat protein
MPIAHRFQKIITRIPITFFWFAAILLMPLLMMGQDPPVPSSTKSPSSPTTPQAQPSPARKPPQAKTQVEYDFYQKIVVATDPKEKMQSVDKFVTDFPDSELRGVAYQQGLRGAQMSNDYEKALEYSRKALQFYPDDILSLLILSTWIPERTIESDPLRDAKLSEAANSANKLLEVVANLKKPEGEAEDQWNLQNKELNGRPHAALGFIALQKKEYAAAETEYEKAINFMPADPTLYYRLGLAYTYEKKYDSAAWNLAKAVSLKGISEKPAKDALDALFKAYGEDPAKAGEEDLIKLAASQEKIPADFSFVKFMEAKLALPNAK